MGGSLAPSAVASWNPIRGVVCGLRGPGDLCATTGGLWPSRPGQACTQTGTSSRTEPIVLAAHGVVPTRAPTLTHPGPTEMQPLQGAADCGDVGELASVQQSSRMLCWLLVLGERGRWAVDHQLQEVDVHVGVHRAARAGSVEPAPPLVHAAGLLEALQDVVLATLAHGAVKRP
eukprot:scaffold19988_cov126-Isochrysis_galbana.AAC.4